MAGTSDKSSSSKKREALGARDPLLALGKRLIEGFGDDGSDTLGRWMALHIAELMEKARTSKGPMKAAAQDRCRDAILALWAHRRELPDGRRPLEMFEAVVNTVAALDPDVRPPFYGRRILRAAEEEVGKEGDDSAKAWLETARVIDHAARVMVKHALVQAAEASEAQDAEWVELAKKSGLDEARDVVLRIMLSDTDFPFKESTADPDAPIHSNLEQLRRLQDVAARVEERLRQQLSKSSD